MSDGTDRRHGAQPGQIGKIRWKDLLTKGLPDGRAFVSDGQGGVRDVTPAEIVGATQLDELADVGTALETDGFVLAADGSKYDGKTPDDAGLVDLSTIQSLTGQKSFLAGLRAGAIDSLGGPTIGFTNKRLVIGAAVNLDEAATLAQVLGSTGGLITVGHPGGARTPDFSDLGEAIEGATAGGGGTIIILDSDSYEATGIDGVTRDMRNVVIMGQPGADPALMPQIRLEMAAGAVEDAGSSSAFPLPDESTGWEVRGCKLGPLAIQAKPTDPAINFSIILDNCLFTDVDPFGVSAGAGADEGVVETTVTAARVTVRNCTVNAAFRVLATKFLVNADGTDATIHIQDTQPNAAGDSVPAPIRMLRTVSGGSGSIFHDATTSPDTVGAGITTLNVDGSALDLHSSGLDMSAGSDGTGADLNKVVVRSGLSVIALDAHLGGTVTKSRRLQLSSNLTADLTAGVGAGGLDAGAAAVDTWYAAYVIGGASPTALLLSLIFPTAAPTTPVLPGGYDVFRYLGGVRTTSGVATDLIISAQLGSTALWQTTQNISTMGAFFTATWSLKSFASFAPPTARRMTGFMSVFASGFTSGDHNLYLAHPDHFTPGGVAVVEGRKVLRSHIGALSGAVGFQTAHWDIDVDSTQSLGLLLIPGGPGALSAWEMNADGWYDSFV